MSFIIVCIISLVTLAVIAGIATHFDKGDDEITVDTIVPLVQRPMRGRVRYIV